MVAISELVSQGAARFEGVSDTALLDAEILMAFAIGKNRTWLKTWPEFSPEKHQQGLYWSLVEKRRQGQPIAYLTGSQGFWSLDLKVTPDTLIPRPETELLIEKVLSLKSPDESVSVLDMGTGTGAIALALAYECPNWTVSACDKSEKTLQVAEHNRQQYSLSVAFKLSDWFSAFGQQQFDVIVSNPPYIEDNDPHLTQGDVRFEPMSALASGADGFDDIRIICANAYPHLNAGGVLLFEHGYNQGETSRQILKEAGFSQVETCKDLNGHERVSLGFK